MVEEIMTKTFPGLANCECTDPRSSVNLRRWVEGRATGETGTEQSYCFLAVGATLLSENVLPSQEHI